MAFNNISSIHRIALVGDHDHAVATLDSVASRWGLQPDQHACFSLSWQDHRIVLRRRDKPQLGALSVDFTSGTLAYRQRRATTGNEALARAVGIKANYRPTILDATAGLGREAFILAALGCQVQMLERHPVVAALLHDGLRRGYQHKKIGGWLSERLRLLGVGNLAAIKQWSSIPDVVYLDPMFPLRHTGALVKKEMQILQKLVGSDTDADQLLAPARALANSRVVVKRPKNSPPLAALPPHASIQTQQCRFDLYVSGT